MAIDKSGNRVRQMFAEIADNYDRMNHLLSMNVDKYWRWRTVKIVPPTGDSPILDVCTGTGDLALAYYKSAQGKVQVEATDFCPEMLAIGEQKKTKRGINGQLRFQEADTQQLPFEDDQFQIVSVAFGLRNVADTDLGLKEMTRVCRPGGKVAVLEFSQPGRQPFKGFYQFYFKHILPRIGQTLAKNKQDAYKYLPESVGEFPHGEALAERMRQAGLREVFFRPLTFGVATLYVGTK